jgi:hypothetical protein
MSSSLVELLIKVAVATTSAIGSPPGDIKHRKRYELLGYSDSIVIFLKMHSFIQPCDFEWMKMMSLSWNAALEQLVLQFVLSIMREIPDKFFVSSISGLDLLIDISNAINIRPMFF